MAAAGAAHAELVTRRAESASLLSESIAGVIGQIHEWHHDEHPRFEDFQTSIWSELVTNDLLAGLSGMIPTVGYFLTQIAGTLEVAERNGRLAEAQEQSGFLFEVVGDAYQDIVIWALQQQGSLLCEVSALMGAINSSARIEDDSSLAQTHRNINADMAFILEACESEGQLSPQNAHDLPEMRGDVERALVAVRQRVVRAEEILAGVGTRVQIIEEIGDACLERLKIMWASLMMEGEPLPLEAEVDFFHSENMDDDRNQVVRGGFHLYVRPVGLASEAEAAIAQLGGVRMGDLVEEHQWDLEAQVVIDGQEIAEVIVEDGRSRLNDEDLDDAVRDRFLLGGADALLRSVRDLLRGDAVLYRVTTHVLYEETDYCVNNVGRVPGCVGARPQLQALRAYNPPVDD